MIAGAIDDKTKSKDRQPTESTDSQTERAPKPEKEINPVGVYSGNAPMGPSTYHINSGGRYTFIGVNRSTGVGEEIQGRGTWRRSGNTIIFNNQGIEMRWELSSDGRKLGPYWNKR